MSPLSNLRFAVPVAVFPTGSLRLLVLAAGKNLNHVTAVKLAVQVGIPDPGVFQFVDPHLAIFVVHQVVIVQVVLLRMETSGDRCGLQVQVGAFSRPSLL